MASWQYAWLTDQPYTTIGFSHPQPGLAGELASVLGVGVFAAQSTEWSISLDRSRVNLGYVSGLLGDRGWEMFAVETRLQPNAMTPAQVQTNWYFKRPGPDRDATSQMASAPAMAATPTAADTSSMSSMSSLGSSAGSSMGSSMGSAPTYDTSFTAPAAAAAPSTMDAATASSFSIPDAAPAMPDAAPAMSSAPEMAPQTAPEMSQPAGPAAPMAPPGPEGASPSGATPPPPGPGGYTPSGG